MREETKLRLKLAGLFLAGIITGAALAYFVNRFDVVYIGLDGIGYLDYEVKASFFHRW